jgi:hypothetical protein
VYTVNFKSHLIEMVNTCHFQVRNQLTRKVNWPLLEILLWRKKEKKRTDTSLPSEFCYFPLHYSNRQSKGSIRFILRDVIKCIPLNVGTQSQIMLDLATSAGKRMRGSKQRHSEYKMITGQLKCDGTRAETRFLLSAKRTNPFKSAGASVQSTTGSRGVRISGSNAGYTMFRGSVKSTGYPLHSPVSPSLPLPCVTVWHHISTGIYQPPPPTCAA